MHVSDESCLVVLGTRTLPPNRAKHADAVDDNDDDDGQLV